MVGFMKGLGCGCCIGGWCDGVHQGSITDSFSPPYYDSPNWGWLGWSDTTTKYRRDGLFSFCSSGYSTGGYYSMIVNSSSDIFRHSLNFNLHDYELAADAVMPVSCTPVGRFFGTSLVPIVSGDTGSYCQISGLINTGIFRVSWYLDFSGVWTLAAFVGGTGYIAIPQVNSFEIRYRQEWVNRPLFPAVVKTSALFNGVLIDSRTSTFASAQSSWLACGSGNQIAGFLQPYPYVYSTSVVDSAYFTDFELTQL